jgi:hypothetical protein
MINSGKFFAAYYYGMVVLTSVKGRIINTQKVSTPEEETYSGNKYVIVTT